MSRPGGKEEARARAGRHGPVSWRLPWRIVENGFDPDFRAYAETIFSQANGYLGIRGDFEESGAPGESFPIAFIAGVYDHPPRLPEELVNLPAWYRIEILLAGCRLQSRGLRLAPYRRALSLRDAVSTRAVVVEDGKGRATRLRFLRFLSAAKRHLAVQQVDITPLNWSGEIEVRPLFDLTSSNQEGRLYRVVSQRAESGGRVWLEAETTRSRVRVAMASRCEVSPAAHFRPVARGPSPGLACRALLAQGETIRLTRYTGLITSRETSAGRVLEEARAIAEAARETGFWQLLRAHRAAWRERWEKAEVVLEGDPVRTNALRFCLLQLMQAAPREDDRVSIGAKALTGEWYRGHFFWDTELFMLPFFIFTQPEVARNLVTYRWRTLPGARANARKHGYRGAMFPWEAALDGSEQTPDWIRPPGGGPRVRVWTGEREHHITADVAFGVWHYAAASGDRDFLRGRGAEVLIEAARFWASRVQREWGRDRYHILGVIGPDEFHENVDDNAFTNALAGWTLRLAANLARSLLGRKSRYRELLSSLRLRAEEPEKWRDIARRLYRPITRGGVIEQYRGFFDLAEAPGEVFRGRSVTSCLSPEKINRLKVPKQADVLMLLCLLPDSVSQEALRKNWDYYEPRTAHESSLSPSIHAIVAADLGLLDKARFYFDWACQLDLSDRQDNTWQGLHAAALGGAWLAAVRGFGGARVGQDGLLRVSPKLPKGWRGMGFGIAYRRGRLSVQAGPRRIRLRYFHPSGRSLALYVLGRRTSLPAGEWKSFPVSREGG